MAPIFTKRKISQYTGKHNVWSYNDYVDFDAFYNPENPNHTGQLFFGVTPADGSAVKSEFSPLSKIVIRAGEVGSNQELQRHIQFRYGRTATDRDGEFAGTWYVNRKNMLLGGSYRNLNGNESNGARDNVAVGYDALTKLVSGRNNVAIGFNTLAALTHQTNNVAIGHSAGSENINSNNTFVGFGAGKESKADRSVAIGYRAGQGHSTASQNLFVGAYSGGGSFKDTKLSGSIPGKGNTAIGFYALSSITTGEQNVAIGYNALGSLTKGNNNVAIGYNACSDITVQSNKTCIGYNSGPKSPSSELRPAGGYNAAGSGSTFLLWNPATKEPIADDTERTYIGGTPRNYGGDAVLELHNPRTVSEDFGAINKTKISGNTTTVINGNLIVRGRPFFTVGNYVHHFHNNVLDTGITHQNLFGYNNTSEAFYSRFTGELQSYDFYSGSTGNKFPDLRSGDPSNSSGNSGGSTTTGGSTGGGGGGGGGGRDCLELQDELRDTLDPMDRHHLQMHMSVVGCSDRRLKNIGERFDGGLDELNKLKVYNFTFKDDKTKRPQVGVLAQELRKVFPTAVFEDENGNLKIRWDEMFYAAINSIKELDKKIVALVKRTTKVETQISKLEKENVELKAQVESLRTRVNKLKAQ